MAEEALASWAEGRRRPLARRGIAGVGMILLLAGAVVAGYGWPRGPLAAGQQPVGVRLASAPIQRTDLTTTVQVPGSLDYGTPMPLIDQASGAAYTALPSEGQVIARGQSLYEVDGAPVTLFYGARPMWRTLGVGVAPGPDVQELEENLTALGFADPSNLVVDQTFTWATAAAIMRWQRSLGVVQTGVVGPGNVAFAPGMLRVDQDAVHLGQRPEVGATVMTTTGTTMVVQAQLSVAQRYLVKPGDHVSVTMPDGQQTVPGTVESVSTSISALVDTSRSTGQDQQPGPTVPIVVGLANSEAASGLEQAPVAVNVQTAQARQVLAVPITALRALAGGGYAISVLDGGAAHLVGVTTGLFTASLVEISGEGLSAGQLVEVPSS